MADEPPLTGWARLRSLLEKDEVDQVDWNSLPPYDSWLQEASNVHNGNRRDLNRLRALALGYRQPQLQARVFDLVRGHSLARTYSSGCSRCAPTPVPLPLTERPNEYVNGDVVLEDDVLIGPHCVLTSNTHAFNPERQSFRGRNENKPIRVGRGAWIAAGCNVTAGVTVGRCSLVCANAVVTKSTPDYAIMAGVPARQVGHVDSGTGRLVWATDAPPSSLDISGEAAAVDAVATSTLVARTEPSTSLPAVPGAS